MTAPRERDGARLKSLLERLALNPCTASTLSPGTSSAAGSGMGMETGASGSQARVASPVAGTKAPGAPGALARPISTPFR